METIYCHAETWSRRQVKRVVAMSIMLVLLSLLVLLALVSNYASSCIAWQIKILKKESWMEWNRARVPTYLASWAGWGSLGWSVGWIGLCWRQSAGLVQWGTVCSTLPMPSTFLMGSKCRSHSEACVGWTRHRGHCMPHWSSPVHWLCSWSGLIEVVLRTSQQDTSCSMHSMLAPCVMGSAIGLGLARSLQVVQALEQG